MTDTVRSRFVKVLNGQNPEDRLPVIEWATWWDLTIDRWRTEGLLEDLDKDGIKRWFGLDVDYQCWIPSIAEGAPRFARRLGRAEADPSPGSLRSPTSPQRGEVRQLGGYSNPSPGSLRSPTSPSRGEEQQGEHRSNPSPGSLRSPTSPSRGEVCLGPTEEVVPHPEGEPWIEDEADYEALLPFLYPDPVPFDREVWRAQAREHAAGEAIAWITLDGFFWFPRTLFGIEPHFYAFFDQPRLVHRINEDLAAYHLKCIEQFCEVCTPDFMTFAEDMSYNHGPMLSKEMFDEFLAPYYRLVIPELERRGIVPLIDSDGDVEPMIPWLEGVGIRGILPLERMAGVDVARIRANHPEWIMIGGFDKTVMHLGEATVRAEFKRLMPVLRQGRFVPSVDHQTPPEVSMEEYREYVAMLREVAAEAVQESEASRAIRQS